MAKTPLAVRLGEFVAALRFEELPPAVVDKAKAFVRRRWKARAASTTRSPGVAKATWPTR